MILKNLKQRWSAFNKHMQEPAMKEEIDRYYGRKTQKNDEQIPLLATLFVYLIALVVVLLIINAGVQEIQNLSIKP